MQNIPEISGLRLHIPEITDCTIVGMVDIKPIEDGLGFFPYSNGLYHGAKAFPIGGVMILGQDFGTNYYVIDTLNGKPESENLPTWRNLKILLTASKIEFNDCFFTNAIIGARINGEPMTGKAPPFKKKKYPDGAKYLAECFEFLKIQVATQKPKLIICMGKWVYEFLNMHLQPKELSGFNPNFSYKEITNRQSYIKALMIGDHETDIALIVHPSTPNRRNTRTIFDEIKMLKSHFS